MNSGRAILKDKKVVIVEDLTKWALGFNETTRRVGFNEMNGVNVSTVFLGLDHGWDDKKSLWFETMIFGGVVDGYQWGYETWEEAMKGHEEAVKFCKRS